MVSFKRSFLALLLLAARNVLAQEEPVVDAAADAELPVEDAPQALKVSVDVSFPQSEIFGVKLVNGHPTSAVLTFKNDEEEDLSITAVGGSLISDNFNPSQIVRNLTVERYGLTLSPGSSISVTYAFTTDLHPQDLRLLLTGIVANSKDAFYTVNIYNSTVSVVEAPISILDPQLIFLYLILAAAFGGTVYFIYTTWITTLFPQQQKKRAPKDAAPRRPKKPELSDPSGPDSPEGATATGSKAYDESWLPAHHLQRPEAKRVASGRSTTPKTKARG